MLTCKLCQITAAALCSFFFCALKSSITTSPKVFLMINILLSFWMLGVTIHTISVLWVLRFFFLLSFEKYGLYSFTHHSFLLDGKKYAVETSHSLLDLSLRLAAGWLHQEKEFDRLKVRASSCWRGAWRSLGCHIWEMTLMRATTSGLIYRAAAHAQWNLSPCASKHHVEVVWGAELKLREPPSDPFGPTPWPLLVRPEHVLPPSKKPVKPSLAPSHQVQAVEKGEEKKKCWPYDRERQSCYHLSRSVRISFSLF